MTTSGNSELLDDWTDCWKIVHFGLDDWTVGPFDYNLIKMTDYPLTAVP